MNPNSTSFLLPLYPEASGHSPRGGNLARFKPGSTGHFLFPLAVFPWGPHGFQLSRDERSVRGVGYVYDAENRSVRERAGQGQGLNRGAPAAFPTSFHQLLHDLSRNFTNRNQPVRSVFRAVAGAGSLPGPPSLPFFKIDHVRHSVPSVSLAHNNETKGRSVAWMQKGFAKS